MRRFREVGAISTPVVRSRAATAAPTIVPVNTGGRRSKQQCCGGVRKSTEGSGEYCLHAKLTTKDIMTGDHTAAHSLLRTCHEHYRSGLNRILKLGVKKRN